MGRVAVVLVLVMAMVGLGGCLYLAYWHFPAPSVLVQKVVPDARFAK
jgi:hypothetical protein